jgi:CheY-like chemotaxis protein
MPFMDGPALIRALRQTNPQARIVAMSGRQSAAKVPRELAESLQAFLTKPFESASLLQAVWGAIHPLPPTIDTATHSAATPQPQSSPS